MAQPVKLTRFSPSTEGGGGGDSANSGGGGAGPRKPRPPPARTAASQHRLISRLPTWAGPEQQAALFQQRLASFIPILTPPWLLALLGAASLACLALGAAALIVQLSLVEVRAVYGSGATDPALVGCEPSPAGAPASCTVTLRAPRRMNGPVALYYELTPVYQAQKRYVSSVSRAQLDAGTVPGGSLSSLESDCTPATFAPDGRVRDPCGLQAAAFFNDSFVLLPSPGGWSLDTSDIAWEADRESVQQPPPADIAANRDTTLFLDEMYPGVVSSVTDQAFLVWMRPAAFPTFRKLIGRINADVPEGATIPVAVIARWPVASFNGRKALVAATTSFLGGPNSFLGFLLLALGAVFAASAGLFALRFVFGGRRLVDTRWLSLPEDPWEADKPAAGAGSRRGRPGCGRGWTWLCVAA